MYPVQLRLRSIFFFTAAHEDAHWGEEKPLMCIQCCAVYATKTNLAKHSNYFEKVATACPPSITQPLGLGAERRDAFVFFFRLSFGQDGPHEVGL